MAIRIASTRSICVDDAVGRIFELKVYEIDPIRDPRWPSFLNTHPEASIFHTSEWLQTLQQTYAYEPIAYTTSAPGEALRDGLPCCRISSRLTGRRVVSLPFADHYQPLLPEPGALPQFLHQLARANAAGPWRYVELRPLSTICHTLSTPFSTAKTAYLHRLNLGPDCGKLFDGFHKSCVQRRIRRAAREGLTYESGRTEAMLAKFYQLQLLMRRKHQLLPQPIAWFRNLINNLGEQCTIYVALQHETPVASIITLRYKHTVIYKYGASDPLRYALGGMIALLWRAIQDAQAVGAKVFDMGRSDQDQTSLVRFKDRWGAARSELHYYRYPHARTPLTLARWQRRLGRHVFARLPDRLLTASGNFLYRHIG